MISRRLVSAVALGPLLTFLPGPAALAQGDQAGTPVSVSPAGSEDAALSESSPRLRIVGVVISAGDAADPKKTAWIVLRDERGQDGGVVRTREGQIVYGYRILRIESAQVAVERGGRAFLLRLGGGGSPGPDRVPAPPAAGPGAAVPTSNGEVIRAVAESRLQQLIDASPDLKAKWDAWRSDLRKRLETDPAFRAEVEERRSRLRERFELAPTSPRGQ